jgi:hypothetical protein
MGVMPAEQVSSVIKTVIRNTAPLLRVDDNEISQEVVVVMLEDLGYLAEVAAIVLKRYRC